MCAPCQRDQSHPRARDQSHQRARNHDQSHQRDRGLRDTLTREPAPTERHTESLFVAIIANKFLNNMQTKLFKNCTHPIQKKKDHPVTHVSHTGLLVQMLYPSPW